MIILIIQVTIIILFDNKNNNNMNNYFLDKGIKTRITTRNIFILKIL